VAAFLEERGMAPPAVLRRLSGVGGGIPETEDPWRAG